MNYNTDRPIDNSEQDLLGRASFANQLGKAIYEYNEQDGLVIGLFGKWGTGKTSVINLAVNQINILSEESQNKPIIMKFAPWNYSDKDNLISIFFQSLKNKLDISDNEELKKKVGKALNDYSGAFDALSLIPFIGSGAAAIVKTLAQVQGMNLMQGVDLDKTKENLENALIETNQKIIIIIDDIDRLANSQIRDVFQLVKQVADFPNVIYVLAMDRDVVRTALTEVHNIDGNEYLEKIIQVPFELPELRKTKLENIFFSKLDQIVTNLPNEVRWDKNYWSHVFRNCIVPYINTLRDVNRVINTFQFRYGMLYQETAFEDMIAITTLEVLEPDLYKWISNNKESVCGGFLHSLSSYGKNQTDYRKGYYDEFKNLGINPDLAIKCVSTLFPVFAKDIKESLYGYSPTNDIRGRMRAAYEGRFELYFMCDLDDIKVSRSLVNACIHELDNYELATAIENINSNENIVYLLEEIRALVNKIPYERLQLIALVILELQWKFRGETSRAIFTISASDAADFLVDDIIDRLETEEEKYEIVRKTLENADETRLGVIARNINRIELAYGRLAADSENKDKQIVSLKHLEELEKLYITKIQSIVQDKFILGLKDFHIIFYLWQCLNPDGAESYMNDIIKDDMNKLKFICSLAGQWNGTNGSGWRFNEKDYSKYISTEEVIKVVQNLSSNQLKEFSEEEQIKLASFILNQNLSEMDYVNQDAAKKLVAEWKAVK